MKALKKQDKSQIMDDIMEKDSEDCVSEENESEHNDHSYTELLVKRM